MDVLNTLYIILFYWGSWLLLYGLLILLAEVCAQHYPEEGEFFFKRYRFLEKFCPSDQTMANFRIHKVLKYYLIEVLILCEWTSFLLPLTAYK